VFGRDECSNSWFAGDDMIESEEIKDEMTSGDAGWMCTRLLEGVEGPWRDLLRV